MKNFLKLCFLLASFSLTGCLGTEVGNGDKVVDAKKQGSFETPTDSSTPIANGGNGMSPDNTEDYNEIVFTIFAGCHSFIQEGAPRTFTLSSSGKTLSMTYESQVYKLRLDSQLLATAQFESSALVVRDAAGQLLTLSASCSSISSSTAGDTTTHDVTVTVNGSPLELTWKVNLSDAVTYIKVMNTPGNQTWTFE